ncbi:hypothetical protein JRQ81_004425 [Phrynocephalus forsythii]|uniref:UDP-glucuronosyltransferase n=1 Tax=Phrynocephalus forsythii TaxID=171643 RepID=A0A9Q1AV76_9SAUR|nr:hypothetical protein JRQ81_004425 [Phrynocephalus forsythii]
MSVKWVLVFPLVLMFSGSSSPGKVLVWPIDFSHWLNMKVILHELIDRGHQVTVLVPSSFLGIDFSQPSQFHVEVISVPFSKEDAEALMQDFIRMWSYQRHELSFWRFSMNSFDLMTDMLQRSKIICDTVLLNETLLGKLESAHFDLVIADAAMPCGELVALKFNRPFIYSLRFTFGNTMERLCGGLPSPPSYVPATMGGFTDRMTFTQRMGNMFFYLSQDILFHHFLFKEFDNLFSEVLGSMVKNLTDEKSALVALALSQLPQKVIWRYKGKKPDTLGANTRLYDWIPQNDLLGHPKTKAFITHGGTNGIYEAIYHSIPLVGIPMFADQPDNIGHMKAKGMAVELNIHTMTAKDLVEAVNTVIHNATYKENAVRISQIHHDQPIKPLERAVFWIEFVMRHKSVKHLRVAAYDLTWYQYHNLDVIAFLVTCVALFVLIAVKCCAFCCWKCCSFRKKTKKE